MTAEAKGAQTLVAPSLVEDGTLLRLLLQGPKGNILTMQMMQEAGAALDAHINDPRLRLVLLRGNGGHFSFGASIEEHRREQAHEMLRTFHTLVRQVAAYPVPVAALVEGSCLGGAFELVLCCHLVFATPGARLGCPEIKLGVYPPVLAALGARRLGSPLAERLIVTGDTITAAEAQRAGLITSVFEEKDPEPELLAWYRRNLLPLSAFSLRQATLASRAGSGMLEALSGILDRIERQYLENLLPSHDGNEGIAAFIERRKPVWEDQ